MSRDIPDWESGRPKAPAMSKIRLVITAVVTENRPVSQVAAEYGVSRSWLYELLARHRKEGEGVFEPRSRRPKHTPNVTPTAVVELIVELREKLATAGLDGHHQMAPGAPPQPPG